MRNPTYEQALTMEGVTWEYLPSVPLSQINLTRSLQAQARLQTPVDQDLIADYAQSMRQGAQFPAIVLWKPPNAQKWVVIDGIQRIHAKIDAKETTTDAYEVQSSDQMVIDRLTWTFNQRVNGRRLSPEECLEHAISFVRKYGMSQKEAAEVWSVPAHKIRDVLAVDNIREILTRQKVDLPKYVNDTQLRELQSLIRCGEDIVADAAKVVCETGITAKEIAAMTGKVMSAKTHDEKMQAVKDFAQSELAQRKKAETRGGRIARPVAKPSLRDRVLRWLEEGDTLLAKARPNLKVLLPGARTEEYKLVRAQTREMVNDLIAAFGLGALPREEAS